jgi:hypothetical protein
MTGDLATDMNDLVSKIIAEISDTELSRVLSKASILRPFQRAEPSPPGPRRGRHGADDEERFMPILDKLERYGFVQVEEDDAEFGGRTYRFHTFLHAIRDRYLACDQERYARAAPTTPTCCARRKRNGTPRPGT